MTDAEDDCLFSGSLARSARPPAALLPNCGRCRLHVSGCRSPKMKVSGRGGRGILLVGERPGCVVGDSLIETAFRDKTKYPHGIPIRDLVGQSGFFVYSFDTTEQKLAFGRVRRVWKTGRKKVYRVTYEWVVPFGDGSRVSYTDSLDVTANHPFLLKRKIKHDPFRGLNDRHGCYLSIEQGLAVGDSLQPFYRRFGEYHEVGSSWRDMRHEPRLLLSLKVGRVLRQAEQCHHEDENKWNDTAENLSVLDIVDHARHHTTALNPMDRPGAKARHRAACDDPEWRRANSARAKERFRNPEVRKARTEQNRRVAHKTSATLKEKYRTDPVFYYGYLLGRQKIFGWSEDVVLRKFKDRFPDDPVPVDNHRIISIEEIGVVDVYDIEVEKYHNFAVHGIFVHNSEEDRTGEAFVGPSGRLMAGVFADLGADMYRDCWLTNALICAPPKSGPPETAVVDCRPNVFRAIRDLNPAAVVLLGSAAIKSVVGRLFKDGVGTEVHRWAGWAIPCHDDYWVCPTYNPAHLLPDRDADPGDDGAKDPTVPTLLFRRHVAAALKKAESRPWPGGPPDYKAMVEVIPSPAAAAARVRKYTGGLVAFDFEHSPLKPDAADADLVCCSVCWEGQETIAFPWAGPVRAEMLDLLENPDVGKIASNMKNEDRWCRAALGVDVKGWAFDTMLAAHALTPAARMSGLKAQAFVRLGCPDYNYHLEPYLDPGKEKGGNAHNRVRDVDPRQLLLYCGMDSLLEFEVAKIQARELGALL